jgi:hypothetical protein
MIVKQKHINTGFIFLMITMVIVVTYEMKSFRKNYSLTVGKVVNCCSPNYAKGSNKSTIVEIDYIDLNGVKYINVLDRLYYGTSVEEANEFILNNYFPLVYCDLPLGRRVKILVSPNDFEEFNIPYPDSLNKNLKYYPFTYFKR